MKEDINKRVERVFYEINNIKDEPLSESEYALHKSLFRIDPKDYDMQFTF